MGIIGSKGDIDINSAFTVRQQNAKQLKKEIAAMRKKINANKDALAEMAEATGETFHSHSLVLAKVMQPGLRCVEQGSNTRGTQQSLTGASPSGLTESSRIRAEEAYTVTQRLAGHTTPYSTNSTVSQGQDVGFRNLTKQLNVVLKAIEDLEKKWAKVSDAATSVTKSHEAYSKANKVVREKEVSYAKKDKDAGGEKMKGYRQQEEKSLKQYTTSLIQYDSYYEDALLCTIDVLNDTYQRWERSVSLFLNGLAMDFDTVSEGVSGVTSSRSSGGSLKYYQSNKKSHPADKKPADDNNLGATPRRRTSNANNATTNSISTAGMGAPLPIEFDDVTTNNHTPARAANANKPSGSSPKPSSDKGKRVGLANTDANTVNRMSAAPASRTPKKNEPFSFDPVVKPSPSAADPATPIRHMAMDPFSVPMEGNSVASNSFALRDEDLSLPPTTKAVY